MTLKPFLLPTRYLNTVDCIILPKLQKSSLDALGGDLDRQDIALCIEFHAVHAGDAVVARGVIDRSTMIDDVIVLSVGRKDTVVSGTGADLVIPLENLRRDIRERSYGRGPGDIADAVGAVAPSIPITLARPFFNHATQTTPRQEELRQKEGKERTHPPTLYMK